MYRYFWHASTIFIFFLFGWFLCFELFGFFGLCKPAYCVEWVSLQGEALWLWLLTLETGNRWQMTGDTWNVTHDTWHVICDTWHMTCDLGHMTHDMWYVTFFSAQEWGGKAQKSAPKNGVKTPKKCKQKSIKKEDLIALVLLSTHVEIVSVSRVRDYYFNFFMDERSFLNIIG